MSATTILTALLLQAAAAAPKDPVNAWAECVWVVSYAWASQNEPAETIATGALAKCSKYEDEVLIQAAIALRSPERADLNTRRLRETMRAQSIQTVLSERARQQANR